MRSCGGGRRREKKGDIPPRLTRTADTKASISHPPTKKKRVALSELPSLSNAVTSRSGAVQSKVKKSRSEKKEQDLKIEKCSCKEKKTCVSTTDTADAESEVEDPHMVAPYAEDIYQYLRLMEVEQKRRPLPNYMETIE
ncbi:cyclin-A3-1-like protein [Carex littledalei]|uniref:Cyclin-A3-1-like protein n=1 Tax=Carex littledalei TaxID=544730 RepID=A0A833VX99_9POAL|nr:cyclin-A3-1-like protein [Carex littledalei]